MATALAVAALLLAAPPVGAAPKTDAKPPEEAYRAALLIDRDDGRVLFAKDEATPWPPASMLKMMTVLLVMEGARDGRYSLDEEVVVSAWASKMGGSQMYLAENERLPLRELLRAVFIHSANDASVAVAEHIAGSSEKFVEMMNARARELGLKETEFHSPHGLPPGKDQKMDQMSARDLATVGRLVAAFPEVAEWGAIQQAPFGDGKRTMYNPNHLLRTYRGATGLKTGYIVASGFSVTATAERDGLRLLAVLMGAPTKQGCFREAAKLLDWGFSNYTAIDPVQAGQLVGPTIAVSEGSKTFFRGRAANGLHLVLPREEARGVKAEVRVPATVSAPITEGQVVGDIVVRRGEQELGRVDVVSPQAIERVAWWTTWTTWLSRWWNG